MAIPMLEAPDFSKAPDLSTRTRMMGDYLYQLYEQYVYTLSNLDSSNMTDEYKASLVSKAQADTAEKASTAQLMQRAKELREEIGRAANTTYESAVSAFTQADSVITSSVAATYTAKTETASVKSDLTSLIQQTANNLTLSFTEQIDAVQGDVNTIAEVTVYFQATSNGLVIGRSDSSLVTRIKNNAFEICTNNGGTLTPVMRITSTMIDFSSFSRMQMGAFGFFAEENGSLSIGRMEVST